MIELPEILIGLFVGIAAGANLGLDPTGTQLVAGMIALALYFGSCFVFPYRLCWVCKGRTEVADRRGNYRHRLIPCWWCGSEKHNRRVGARLIGRG